MFYFVNVERKRESEREKGGKLTIFIVTKMKMFIAACGLRDHQTRHAGPETGLHFCP